MRELTALEYFKIKNYITDNCRMPCYACRFGGFNNEHEKTCAALETHNPEAAINIAVDILKKNPDIIKEEKAIVSNEPMTRKSILENAEKCVCGSREEDYGSPEDNFKTIASLWEIYLKTKCVGGNSDVSISPEDVATMMILVKIARISSGHAKSDNWIDIAGYAACGGEIEGSNK